MPDEHDITRREFLAEGGKLMGALALAYNAGSLLNTASVIAESPENGSSAPELPGSKMTGPSDRHYGRIHRSRNESVAIIGGGIAGLTALRELTKYGVNATLFEKEEAVGGRMKTVYVDGKPVDVGGNVISKYYPGTNRLIDELGLTRYKKKVNVIGPGGIVKNGGMIPISLDSFFPRGYFGLAGGLSIAKLVPEILSYARAFGKTTNRLDSADFIDPWDAFEDRIKGAYSGNFYDYLRKKVSQKLLDDLMDPLGRLPVLGESTKDMGRVVGMGMLISATTSLYAMEGGAQTLTGALHRGLSNRVHLGEAVERVVRDAGRHVIKTNRRENAFDFVIATVPVPDLEKFSPGRAENMGYTKGRVTVLKGGLKTKYKNSGLEQFLVVGEDQNVYGFGRSSGNIFTVTSGVKEPELGDFFEAYDVVHTQLWDPCLPKVSAGTKFPEVEDETGTYYLAGNHYLPCIEMSVQTARAAAKKIAQKALLA